MIVVVEGPEKAGKTTFINALEQRLVGEGYQVERRKLNADDEDDRRYSPMLQEDMCKLDKVVIWDRGWISEYVYATLLERPRRAAHNPWLMEWIHSRAVRPNGALFTVVPEDLDELYERRDSTDLPVDPWLEARLFIQHSIEYDWQILEHSYTGPSLQKIVDAALETIRKIPQPGAEYLPPRYAGPVNSQDDKGMLVVAPLFSESPFPGAWLPGSSELLTKLGIALGPYAPLAAWTTPENLTKEMVSNASVIVAIGHDVFNRVMDKLPLAQTIDKYPRLWEISPAWLTNGHEVLRAKQIISSLHENWWKQYAPNN